MAMLLGVAVFGFSYQMRPIDAKNGNVISNFCSLYYVNLRVRIPSENLTPQISPSALSFFIPVENGDSELHWTTKLLSKLTYSAPKKQIDA